MIGYSIAIHALTVLQQTVPPIPDADREVALEALRRRPRPEGILVPLAFFALIAFWIWLRMLARTRRAQAQADLQKQLLDKFASGPELSAFLESPGGQRFLAELHSQAGGARAQAVRSLQAGVIFLALGAALLILKAATIGANPQGQAGFLIAGVIVSALGIGFLISAAISHRLTKQWDADQKTGGPAAPIS